MTDPKTTPFVPASLMMLYNDAPVLADGRMGRLYGSYKPVDGHLLVSFRGGACGSFPASDVRFLLDSPLAMCHAARWLAAQLGCDPGTTAPGWVFVPADDDGMVTLTPAHFRLVGPDWIRVFTEEEGFNAEYFFGDPRSILRETRSDAGVEAYEVHPWHPTTVPGILGMGPAAALAAACVAVGGAS